MIRKRIPAWSCGDISQVCYQMCNHPESGGDASKTKSEDAVSRPTKCKKLSQKRRMLIALGASVYLPVYPLWWTSTTSLQPPMLLLLATQGWLTLSICLLTSRFWCDAQMTPNDQAHPPPERREERPERRRSGAAPCSAGVRPVTASVIAVTARHLGGYTRQ